MPYKRLLLEFAVQKIICASPYIELSSKDYRILQVKSSPSAEFPSVLPKKKKKKVENTLRCACQHQVTA